MKAAVPFLRELSQHPLEDVFTEIRDILAKAGVALVITPILEKSALRGCARLLTSRKAIINLSIKYRKTPHSGSLFPRDRPPASAY